MLLKSFALRKLWILIFCLVFGALTTISSQSADIKYATDSWFTVLENYVDDQGFVDYEGLYNNSDELNNYVEIVESAGPVTNPAEFPTRNHELAYYINAYNALVFQGVLDRGPETKSVWSGLISGLNFFVRMDVLLDNDKTNLRNLENNVIREKYQDPRIHAALVCASVSCPRLIKQPYSADTLDSQLDQSIKEFISNPDNVFVDEDQKTVYLSEIFDWFDIDFIEYERQAGNNDDPNQIDYINRYRDAGQKISKQYKIKFSDYDKSINSQARKTQIANQQSS